MSSSYFPSLLGSPDAVATAGTFKIVSSQRIQVKTGPSATLRPRRTCEHHVRYAERRCDGRATHLDVVRDEVDALQDLIEVRGDRDLGHRERQLAVLDPEALRAA